MVRNILIMALALLLLACNGNDIDTDFVKLHGEGFEVSTPASLRMLDSNALKLELAIDGSIKTYFASDFPDGNWSIERSFEANREYVIDIRWFHNETLLLHEHGSFFTDPESPVITLDLDVADSGTREFDNDCDSINNLQALRDGTDPGANPGTSCPQNPSLNDPLAAYVARNFLSFKESGYRDNMFSFEQPIRIRATNTNRGVSYWTIVSTEPYENATEAKIELSFEKDLRTYAYFEINNSTASEGGLTATCDMGENGWFCRIPLDWQTDKWYTLKLELVADNQWQASIIESASGDTIPSGVEEINQYIIGTITTSPDILLRKPRFGLNYRGTLESFNTCENGLPRLAMQAATGKINGVFDTLLPSTTTISRCVDGGIGWRTGTREINGSQRYYLSLGDGRVLQ